VQKTTIKISLVGNPNSGKSTLFNHLTGLNQKIANFPGVTVEKRSGKFSVSDVDNGNKIEVKITDLPGTYSLYPKTLEEQVPFKVLCDPSNPDHPDKVIVIADGLNLKRSLFLCSQVIDLKIPVILAVNMMDRVVKNGLEINFIKLADELGIPVVPINSLKGEGVDDLKKVVSKNILPPQNDFINTRDFAPDVIDNILKHVKANSDYAAFQIANNIESIDYFNSKPERLEEIRGILKLYEFDSVRLQAAETLERYKVISSLLKGIVHQKADTTFADRKVSKKIDDILTHKVWGYVIFLFVLFVIFQAIFAWATVPMELVDSYFAVFSNWVKNLLPAGMFNDLIVNGVLAGLGGVLIFIPQIALLFLFVGVLEDTGYMARVSFMIDKLFRKVGLNGRSVIPLMSGVACAVPAIMSTRTIKSWKERLITIMVTPLMSCSARLPVYALLIAMVIPQKSYFFGLVNQQGLVLMSLYLLGFVAAIGSALVINLIVKAKERSFYIMELPVYRLPRVRNLITTLIEKVKIFVFDAGKIIVAISIVLWALASTGPTKSFDKVKRQLVEAEKSGDTELVATLEAEKLEKSYAGLTGKALEPLIKPLGFDWKIGIALITSFAAREVFVGTMATIYSVGSGNEDLSTVRQKMTAEKNPQTGEPMYNLAVGWSLMLFYAFAMQCMSTLAVVKRETGSWKWPAIQFTYMGILAYISSFIVYQLLS
jgi:ferrous iron transport protein B